uniref:Uncharacterized protein n=1 Tax=Avena sativa TaxID=4498 RepID=A0ACD5W367_AVESA
MFQNGEEIAVKALHNITCPDEKEFHKEFDNLKRLQHRNIVKLVGFCIESEYKLVACEGKLTDDRIHMALCFEYVHNGTLSMLISDANAGFDWHTRYRIIKGICEGIKYLRERLEYPIMHFNLKLDNILLDQNIVPKIADFGLINLLGQENIRRKMNPVSTCAYWPPEYINHGILSEEFDIFSLGVIIIQIIAGHQGYTRVGDMARYKFFKHVHETWRKRLCETVNQESLEVLNNQVKRCIELALKCLISNRKERPTILDIISNLKETETMIGDRGPQIKQASGEVSRYMEPKAMTFQELKRMTCDFAKERLLGRGGYGMVYKGVLENGEAVAVKKLYSQPGFDGDQFKNELLNLMRVQHQNIIRLVGYCSEKRDRVVEHEGKLVVASMEEKALCLEYMQGGTLEELISDESCGLDWKARYKIIKRTCQGLKYLHTGSKDPIYHLDLKPTNILLDQHWVPKIGDFGLSRLLSSTGTFVTQTNSGTLVYMPPEYTHGQQISSKFDVFSLGVIIIQIIAGLDGYYNYKCLYKSSQEFIANVIENWCKRVEEKTMSAVALLDIEECIKIALRCVEENRAKRPTITQIVEELNMIS